MVGLGAHHGRVTRYRRAVEIAPGRHLMGAMCQKPSIIIAAILVALTIGYFAWQKPGAQPMDPERPAGYQADKPGLRSTALRPPHLSARARGRRRARPTATAGHSQLVSGPLSRGGHAPTLPCTTVEARGWRED